MRSDPTLIERRYKANPSTVAAVCERRRVTISTLIDRRRVGKITLSHSMQGVSYFDCDLPRVRRIIEEGPEEFLGQDMKLLT